MKKILLNVLIVLSLAFSLVNVKAFEKIQKDEVIIYHLYGAGGNKNAKYNQDFIVLKNQTNKDIFFDSNVSFHYHYKANNNDSIITRSLNLPDKIKASQYYVIAGRKDLKNGQDLEKVDVSNTKMNLQLDATGVLILKNGKDFPTNDQDENIIDIVKIVNPKKDLDFNSDIVLEKIDGAKNSYKINDENLFKETEVDLSYLFENKSSEEEVLTVSKALDLGDETNVKVLAKVITNVNNSFCGTKGFYVADEDGTCACVYTSDDYGVNKGDQVLIEAKKATYKNIGQLKPTKIQKQQNTTTINFNDGLKEESVKPYVSKLKDLIISKSETDNYQNLTLTFGSKTIKFDSRNFSNSQIEEIKNLLSENKNKIKEIDVIVLPNQILAISKDQVVFEKRDVEDEVIKNLDVKKALAKEKGTKVKVEGYALTSPNGAYGGKKGFYLADLSGEAIYVFSKENLDFSFGRLLVVEGVRDDFNGVAQIVADENDKLKIEIKDVIKKTQDFNFREYDSNLKYPYLVSLDNLKIKGSQSDKYNNLNLQLEDDKVLRIDSRAISNTEKLLNEIKANKDIINNAKVVAGLYKNNVQFQAINKDLLDISKASKDDLENEYQKVDFIGQIQGKAHYSPFENKKVKIENVVVTSVISDRKYTVQDIVADGDDKTSDGVMIYDKDNLLKVKVGDVLNIFGRVEEFQTVAYQESSNSAPTTQIVLNKVIKTSVSDLPKPVIIKNLKDLIVHENGLKLREDDDTKVYDPDKYSFDYLESLEGMLVKYEKPVVVAPSKYGDIYVVTKDHSSKSDLFNEKGGVNITEKGRSPYVLQIHIYDKKGRNFNKVVTKAKDYFTKDVVGVIDYGFLNYYLAVSEEDFIKEKYATLKGGKYYFEDGNLEKNPISLSPSENELLIASYNIENYSFANSDSLTKAKKLAYSVVNELNKPDILAVAEMQDDSGKNDDGITSAKKGAQRIIDEIKKLDPNLVYKYVDVSPLDNQDGGMAGGNIRLGFFYNSTRVNFLKNSADSLQKAEYDASKGLNFNPVRINPASDAFLNSRKPLVGEFEFNNQKVLVIANHWNSKRGDGALYGLIQPVVLASEAQRMEISKEVGNFVKDVLSKNKDANIVALGDFNDYEWSNPIKHLESYGLYDIVKNIEESKRFSYNYQGQAQNLDQLFVSQNLLDKSKIEIAHINSIFMAEHGRVSDHDPLAVSLKLEKIKRKVVLKDFDSSKNKEILVNDQEIIGSNLKDPITFEGVNFIGWFDEAGRQIKNDTTIDKDLVLTPKFKTVSENVEIIYDVDHFDQQVKIVIKDYSLKQKEVNALEINLKDYLYTSYDIYFVNEKNEVVKPKKEVDVFLKYPSHFKEKPILYHYDSQNRWRNIETKLLDERILSFKEKDFSPFLLALRKENKVVVIEENKHYHKPKENVILPSTGYNDLKLFNYLLITSFVSILFLAKKKK